MLRPTRRGNSRRSTCAGRRRGFAAFAAVPLAPGMLLATNFVSEAWKATMNWINHLDRNAWLIVLCCALVIGTLCLRGFGSRSNY